MMPPATITSALTTATGTSQLGVPDIVPASTDGSTGVVDVVEVDVGRDPPLDDPTAGRSDRPVTETRAARVAGP
jgi:hypothetical protein